MRRNLSRISVVLGASGLLAAGLASSAYAATTASAASTAKVVAAQTPAWQQLLSVKNSTSNSPFDESAVTFDAVVATGPTTGWAFRSDSTVAYERTGAASWKQVAFPGGTGTVEAAAATSPSNVWTAYDFSGGSQIDHWNGRNWSVVKTFPGYVNGLSVLGAADVWVYGGVDTNDDGIWHYHGGTWTEVSSTLQGGSALSDQNVWASTGATIEHFNGKNWSAANVANLLPANSASRVAGIVALSPEDVYATGNGPHGAPLMVLHYNGNGWAKVASGSFQGGEQLASDGHGGLWVLAVNGNEEVLHYTGGNLTVVNIPSATSQPVEPSSIALIPGTSGLLVGGYQYVTTSPSYTSNSLVLQYP
jgi:hypothetical protein